MSNMLKAKIISSSLQRSADGAAAGEDEYGPFKARAFFTSDSTDMTGDIITRAATERAIPAYRQWRNLRFMHEPRPVGVVERIGVEDGLAWNELELIVYDKETAYLCRKGVLRALSVGILVDLDNVQPLETGGLVINDYVLAEISVVDHPANYDAVIKQNGISMDGVVAKMAGTGFLSYAKALEVDMPKKKAITDEPIAEEVAPAVIEEVAPVVEEVVVEKAAEAAAPSEPEAAPAEAEAAVEPEAVVKSVTHEELEKAMAEVLEKATAAIEAAVSPLADATNKAIAAFDEVAKQLAAMNPQTEAVEETPAEDLPKEDKGVDGGAPELEAVQKELAALREQNEQLLKEIAVVKAANTPVDQTGAVLVDAEKEVVSEEDPRAVIKALPLKDAIRKIYAK